MITVYSLSYTQEIYAVRAREKWNFFASAVMAQVTPLVKSMFERGVFLALVDDLDNQGQCKASFLLNQGIEIPIRLSVTVKPSVVGVDSEDEDEEPRLVVKVDPQSKFMLHSPKRTRDIIQATVSAAGIDWESVKSIVGGMVEKLYADSFVFVETDADNASSLRILFGYSDDVELNVRLKAATPQKVTNGSP
jgi:hypothetical protein